MKTKANLMNPFPGLRAFQQDEDYLFFGREEQTMELIQRLGTHRFVAVVGTSGSGKSSLVRCGLLSELLGGKLLRAGTSWEVAVTHPGGNPLGLLTESLLDADLYDRDQENVREQILATLNRSHFGLVEAVKQAGLGEGTNFLLVVDQFEEIFRFHEAGQTQQEMANEFVSLLLEAVAQADVPIYVVLTMRSDFIGECGQFEGLAERVNQGEFLIPRLTRDQYKRVIEGPVKVAGGKIAPRLLQRLLNDLGQQADQLPCLQHALMRTWTVWQQRPDADALDLDDYQLVGRMSQALSLHADEIYSSLDSDRQRELCKGIFQALTVEESNSRGIRRPQRLGRLCQILEVEAAELVPIIDAFRQSGVTFLMPPPHVELTDQTIIDISHESLMRVWTRLRQWVEEETQAAGIYHRLSESAHLHEQGKAGLFRDPELGIALAWRESKRPNAAWAERYRPGFATAIAFLEASQQASVAEEQAREAAQQRELQQAQQLAEAQQLRLEQQQRAAQKLRKLIGGLAVVAVIAGFACVVALFANQRANRLAETAKQNEIQAKKSATRAEQSQQETAKVLAVVESQKATVENSLTKAKQAEQVARAAEETGRKLLYTTDMRLAPFVWRDDRTTAEQLRVLLTKHIPDSQSKVGEARDASVDEGESSDARGSAGASPSQEMLASQKSDLRGFEWYYYQNLLERSAAVFSGADATILSGALDPNGQLVTLDEDGQIRRWNLGSQDEDLAGRRDLPGGSNMSARALSPNGRLVAIAADNTVSVHDTVSGRQLFQANSTASYYRQLAFSPDGSKLVIVDNQIRWYNAISGQMLASLNQQFTRLETLALSADGLTVAAIGDGSTGHLFSTFRLNAMTTIAKSLAKDVGRGGTLQASAMSSDGQLIAVGAMLSGNLFISDAATGRPIAQHGAAHASPISAMAFTSDGRMLATADSEGTIKIWNSPSKLNSKSAAQLTLKGHQGSITTMRFSSDGSQLVTTSVDKTARVWDLENAGAAIRPLETYLSGSSFVARYSPDGQLVAIAGGRDDMGSNSTSRIRLWDANSGKLVRELSNEDNTIAYCAAFSPTDHRLLAVGYGGHGEESHVILWDIDSGTELARLPGATDLPNFAAGPSNSVVGALAFSPDGKHLVASFGSKNMLMGGTFAVPIKVWDVGSRQLIRRLNGHTNYVLALTFSNDGKVLASGSRDGTAILWSTATWKPLQTLQNPDQDTLYVTLKRPGMVDDVAFSPDGKTLAMASREKNIHLWDVASGRHLDALQGHSSAVSSLVYSPDGRTLASGSGDQTVRLWNVETRRELLQLDSGSVSLGELRTLAYSPDGTRLIGGGDRTAFWFTTPLVWNDPDRAADQLRLVLKSNADFQSRIRMLSENLRLHAALEKLDSQEPQVAAALAATKANWHASRQAWPEAVAAFDQLLATDPKTTVDWLRTPGLMRLATALLHQDRPAEAARLLAGGAERRARDGLSKVTEAVALGLPFIVVGMDAVVSKLPPGSPAAKSGVREGDIIDKVNDVDLANESIESFIKLLAGEAGTQVRLTVRRAGSDKPMIITVTREKFLTDVATGELLHPLRDAVNARLAKEPRHPGLLELRAELAGQWSDTSAQVADYTAAIDALSEQASETVAPDLQRLYARRGKMYFALRQWKQAADDFARVVTDATTDETLLANHAYVLAESLLNIEALVPTSEHKGMEWRYTTQKPADDWNQPGFKDATWRVGTAPFGTTDAKWVQTTWTTPDIWLRHSFEFDKAKQAQSRYVVRIACDDFADVYLNGKLLSRQDGHTDQKYVLLDLDPQVGDQFVQGTNIVSVHCNNVTAVGYIDVGLFVDRAGDSERMKQRFAVHGITAAWTRLAAAYHLAGHPQAIDELLARRPNLAGPVGDAFVQKTGPELDWNRAVEIYSRGLAAAATDVELFAKRARAYEELKNWEAASADWSRAAADKLQVAKSLAEFAGRLAKIGHLQSAKSNRETALKIYEEALTSDPENDVVAEQISRLLLDESPRDWAVLKPATMTSKTGATLTAQEDGSVLASGTHVGQDLYTITTQADLPAITTLRLEALPHSSLPANGPGRHSQGWFKLSGIKVRKSKSKDGGTDEPVRITDVSASYQFVSPTDPAGTSDAKGMIEDKAGKSWHTWGRFGQAHEAVFSLANPITLMADEALTIQLQFEDAVALGCFRLSVSSDPMRFESDRLRFELASDGRDPWIRLAAAYALRGRQQQAVHYFGTSLKRADGYEAKNSILGLASRFDKLFETLAQGHPQDSLLQLTLARKLAERGRQRLTEKQPAQAQAELQKSLDVYTRLRVTAPQSKWTVPTPSELTSKGGEKLTVESDGSVFVSGPKPKRSVYTLKLPSNLKTLTAIRLETMPDARLPEAGAGRYGNGNFHLAEFSAAVIPKKAGGRAIPVRFSTVLADTPQSGGLMAQYSIDGKPRTYWDTYPKLKEAHWVVFGVQTPIVLDGGDLNITLDSGITSWGEHGLGHFRISLTDEPEAVNRTQQQTDFKESEVAELNVALGKAHAQQGHLNEAVAALTAALALATERTVKSNIISEAAHLAGVLEKLAQSAAQDGQFQTELARHYVGQGNAALADAARTKALALLEQQLAKEPENVALATDLADLLLIDTTHWTVLKPTEVKSKEGTTFTLQADGSILPGGPNPDAEVYTVISDTFANSTRLLRLELLPHPSIDNGATGRGSGGLFTLTELSGLLSALDGTGEPEALKFISGAAQFRPELVLRAIDGKHDDSEGYWNSYPHGKDATSAVFTIEPRMEQGGTSRVAIHLDFLNKAYKNHNLGCFRLSVSDDPAAFEREQKRYATLQISEPWTRLAVACALVGRFDPAVTYLGKALKASDGHEARKAILADVMQYDGLITALARLHPDELQPQLALARSLTTRGRAALAANNTDGALAELKQAQDIYTRLLPPIGNWTVLTPVEMQTESESQLTLQNDGSIFVDKMSKNDIYTLVFQTDLKGINGLRLEALSDSRLPNRGAGWSTNDGNFVISEVSLQIAPAKGTGQPRPVPLRNASADYSQGGWNARGAIDGNIETGWAISPLVGRNHTALFELSEAVGDGQAIRLTVQIKHTKAHETFVLGRFRLSVTNDAATLQNTRMRVDLNDNEVLDLYTVLAQVYVQQGQTNEAIAAVTHLLTQTSDHATRAKIIAVAGTLTGLLEKLAETLTDDAQVQAELSRQLAAQGNALMADAARQKARTLLEQQLASHPDGADAALGLADLLLIDTTQWTVLTPTEMNSDFGARLEMQDDGSVFVNDPTKNDNYSLTFKTDVKGIRSLRLEALTDPRLPNSGPGWSDSNGNFVLNELTLHASPVNTLDQPQPMAFKNAAADYSQVTTGGFHVRGAVDGNKDSGWAIYPETGKNHVAIFELAEPMGDGQPLLLTLRLDHVSTFAKHTLGRFRISVTDDPRGFERQQVSYHAIKSTDPWVRLAVAYAASGEVERAADLLAKSLQTEGIALWQENGLLSDGILSALKSKYPQQYATLLPGIASAAVERGEIDEARAYYERLAGEQPENSLWKERIAQLQPGVFAIWNFDTTTGSWGSSNDCELSVKGGVLTVRRTGNDPAFQSPVTGPAGTKSLILRYRAAQACEIQIFWSDETGDFSDERHWNFPVPATGSEWREIMLPFRSEGALNKLRLDCNTASDQTLEIDSILLRQLDPAEYAGLVNDVLIEPELAKLAIPEDSLSAEKYLARARFLARLGRWREANVAFDQDRKLSPPNRSKWFMVALMRLLANDPEGYQEFCRAMAEQFRDATDPEIADSVCKACLLSPGAIDLSELPIKFLRDSTNDPKLDKGVFHWFVACCALISYREDDFEEAIAWTKKHPNLTGQSGSLALVVRAMAEHKLGQTEEARKTLAQAAAIIPAELKTLGTEDYTGPLPVSADKVTHDWLAPEILRREADALINPKPDE